MNKVRFDGHVAPMIGYCSNLCKMNMEKIMSDYGMTQSQTHVMIYLAKRSAEGEVTQSDIERTFRIRAPTVNGIVKRLEEKGLITRGTGASDARCRSIKLTEKGSEMYEIFRHGARESERRITRGMTKEEKDTLVALMRRVVENLEEESE